MAAVAGLLQYVGEEHNPNEAEYSTHESSVSVDTASGDESEHKSSVTSFLEEKHPVKEALKKENLPALFSSMFVPMLGGCGWYVTFIWMAIFMESMLDPPVPGAFWVNLAALMFGNQIPSLLTGWWSDSVGRTKLMLIGVIGTGLSGPFFVWIISQGNTVGALFAQMALGVVLSFYTGPLFAWLPEKFPPKTRLTSAALGYNIGICFSAGFSPTIATALVQNYGNVAPGYMYPFFAFATLLGMFIATKIKYEDGGIDDTTVDNTAIDAESVPNVDEEGRTSPLLV
jgi:MHS family proline/betaine transporter-like MFS transporter